MAWKLSNHFQHFLCLKFFGIFAALNLFGDRQKGTPNEKASWKHETKLRVKGRCLVRWMFHCQYGLLQWWCEGNPQEIRHYRKVCLCLWEKPWRPRNINFQATLKSIGQPIFGLKMYEVNHWLRILQIRSENDWGFQHVHKLRLKQIKTAENRNWRICQPLLSQVQPSSNALEWSDQHDDHAPGNDWTQFPNYHGLYWHSGWVVSESWNWGSFSELEKTALYLDWCAEDSVRRKDYRQGDEVIDKPND